MVCGSQAKTRAMYSPPPCPSLATSTAAYRRRSFSDSQQKNRCIFCSTSAEYTSMPHSLIRGFLCSKDTAAQAIREVILDHILNPDAGREVGVFHIVVPDLDCVNPFGDWAGRPGNGWRRWGRPQRPQLPVQGKRPHRVTEGAADR